LVERRGPTRGGKKGERYFIWGRDRGEEVVDSRDYGPFWVEERGRLLFLSGKGKRKTSTWGIKWGKRRAGRVWEGSFGQGY
jgi:hypothetical protein